MTKTIEDFKSTTELYFHLYCEELKEAGFIKDFHYELSGFPLTGKYARKYTVQGKRKVLHKEEHLLNVSTITADFTIEWTKKAENLFYLNASIPIHCKVKEIPFRLVTEKNDYLFSCLEIKPAKEMFNSASSVSFPYKQKFLQDKHNMFIQKIKPFDPKNGLLFQDTFTPKEVIRLEVYKVNSGLNKKGDSKLKYNIKTLEEFLNEKSK